MVGALLEAEARLLARGARVAALGPVYYDQRVGKSWPFYRMSMAGMTAHRCDGQEIVPCDFLISSGSMIRLSVLDEGRRD